MGTNFARLSADGDDFVGDDESENDDNDGITPC